MTTRPIVPTAIRTEFGDVLDSPEFYDVAGRAQDLTYVPGYSDLRRARDLALKEVAEGKRKAQDVPRLDVRLQLVRAQRPGRETPDTRKPIEFKNSGYRAVTRADIGQPWLTGLAEGMVEGPGGELYIGDTKLMVADAKTAARNAAIHRVQTDMMVREKSLPAHLAEHVDTSAAARLTETTEKGPEIKVRQGPKGTQIVG